MAISNRQPQFDTYMLHNGDCMMRPEFHDLYAQMPDGYRAELLGGIVFEPSSVSWYHGEYHGLLNYLLKTYSIHTPGTALGDNASIFLSEEDEVQPDLVLRVSRGELGKSRLTERGFIEGAPELVAEIAYSSRAIDLHLKKKRYALSGVIEYIVVCLEPKRFYWFDLAADRELSADKYVTRSSILPGLWLHGNALLDLDHRRAVKTLNRGLKSQEHGIFVAKLAGQ